MLKKICYLLEKLWHLWQLRFRFHRDDGILLVSPRRLTAESKPCSSWPLRTVLNM